MDAYPVGNVFPLYTPHLLLITAPLALLPYDVSQAAYWTLGVAAYPAFAALSLATCGIPVSMSRTFLLAAGLIVSVPGRWNFDMGQPAIFLSIACVAALHLAPSRPRQAAIALALACVKPTFGIPFAILMFASGSVRVVLTAAAMVAAGSAIALGTVLLPPWMGKQTAGQAASDEMSPLCGVVIENQALVNADSVVDPHRTHTRIDGVVLLIQVLGAPATHWVDLAWFAVCIGVCSLILRREADGPRMATPAAGLMLLATVVCVYHQTYDAVLLVPLLLWLLRNGFRSEHALHPGYTASDTGKLAVAGLLVVPFVNIFWSKIFLGLLQNSLGIANDTIMAITRSAGLFNSIACVAALVGVAWMQVKALQTRPARSFRTLGSAP
jgi:hypothetical protein